MAADVQAFLSVQEAADYLNVEYKTVYRLVRSGRLPAGKIGGVYRIKKADLDDFFEQQKAQTARGPGVGDPPACGSCGREMLSSLSLGGRCLECGAPLCLTCWQWEQRRHCSDHQPADPAEAARPAEEPPSCARCRRLLVEGEPGGGRCEAEGCGAPLCSACWSEPDGHLCPTHAPALEEKLAEARRLLQEGKIPCLVTSLEARKREIGFIGRFDRKVRQVATIRNPVSEQAVRVQDWESRHAAGDDSGHLLELLGVGYLDAALLAQLPVNLRSRYQVQEGGDRVGLVLEVLVLSRLEAHARRRFDSAPAGLVDLLPLLEAALQQAEGENAARVLGVASTSGWEAEAAAYVRGDSRGGGFSHRLLMPCLVDLGTGELAYNALDRRLACLVSLFSPQLPEEALEELAGRVREMLEGYGLTGLPLARAAVALEAEEGRVLKAFHRLAESGQFTVEQIKGLGPTLVRR